MPSVRVVSWNSGGEDNGRGAQLIQDVTAINATAPQVELVAIQEAQVDINPPKGPGEIYEALGNSVNGPFAAWNTPDLVRELSPLQTQGGSNNKAYLIGWNPARLTSAAPAALISLAPAPGPPPNGVEACIQGLAPGNRFVREELRVIARNIRAPVRKHFTLTIGAVTHNIFFYTWHVPLKQNWRGAEMRGLNAFGAKAPGLYVAFLFFQSSKAFTDDYNNLAATDVLIIAGDLNIYAADLGLTTIFPKFEAISDNLSHILAYSKSGALLVTQDVGYVTPFPPHVILSAEVQW